MRYYIAILFLTVISVFETKAEVDPNFHIYLCFGQSNMEGGALSEEVDRIDIDDRFLTLATTDSSFTKRAMGKWYKATPPIDSEKNVISLTDYFGRSMVAALPADHRVGVVVVSIGGADIRAFMPENTPIRAADYLWSTEKYGEVPYRRLVDMAKIAQKSGVIKGILLHQGEANCGLQEWPSWVKTIYDNLISDLGLNAAEVPLLVGEVVNASEGGTCAEHNEIIAQVPSVIPTAHVISSIGCPGSLHFSAVGYRILGKRYAIKMLELLGYPPHKNASYQLPESLRRFYRTTGLDTIPNIDLQPDSTYNIPEIAYFEDGHQENIMFEGIVSSIGNSLVVNGNQLTAITDDRSIVTVSYTDFTGKTVSSSFNVNPSGSPSGIIDEMVGHIMGRPSETFNKNAADMNADGKVNVTDIVHIVNEK